jgi:hypothetical protein
MKQRAKINYSLKNVHSCKTQRIQLITNSVVHEPPEMFAWFVLHISSLKQKSDHDDYHLHEIQIRIVNI